MKKKMKNAAVLKYAKPTYIGVKIPHVDGYAVDKTYAKMMAIQAGLNAILGQEAFDMLMEYVDCAIDLHIRNVHDAAVMTR